MFEEKRVTTSRFSIILENNNDKKNEVNVFCLYLTNQSL